MTKYPWRGNLPALVERVQELHTQGYKINSGAMVEAGGEHLALYTEVWRKHKLAWSDVLQQAGLEQHAKHTRDDYPWRRNLPALLTRVQEIHEQQHDVNARAMQQAGGEHQALIAEAKKRHGLTWSQVLQQAGLAQHAKHGIYPWRNDLQALLARVQEIHEQQHDVNARAMQRAGGEHLALLKEAKNRHQLKWSDILRQAGLAQHAKRTIGNYA